MHTAGHWTIEVADKSHPAWVTITYEGGWGDEKVIRHIHHKDLRDLEYVLSRAIKDAAEKLGPSHKHEVA